jgi:hypothetical protein
VLWPRGSLTQISGICCTAEELVTYGAVTCPYTNACLHSWPHDVWSHTRLKFNFTGTSVCFLRRHSWMLCEHSLLHDRQNESRRWRVTCIYAFIHTRDKIWQEITCERMRKPLCGKTRAIRNILLFRFSFSSYYFLAHCHVSYQNEFWKCESMIDLDIIYQFLGRESSHC